MSYTPPPTFEPGDPLAAAELNILSDDIAYLAAGLAGTTFSGVKLSRSANQSIPDSTDTAISWSSEVYDLGSWWSSGETITVPAGAIPEGGSQIACLVIAAATFATNGTGSRRLRIDVGGDVVASWPVSALSGDQTSLVLSDVVVVEAADDIEILAYQSSGGALNVTEARLTIVRLGLVA